MFGGHAAAVWHCPGPDPVLRGPDFSLGKPELLASLPTLVFAWKTRSLGGTVLVGMLLYWLIGKIL
ncbi:MAG: AzlD domain-containing protein [Deltaproteobacteria bacterium]|nr:AzlD domain-containing protein [Deltaproteobacteria bacterium]